PDLYLPLQIKLRGDWYITFLRLCRFDGMNVLNESGCFAFSPWPWPGGQACRSRFSIMICNTTSAYIYFTKSDHTGMGTPACIRSWHKGAHQIESTRMGATE